jgi:nucleoside diphosphate kinase
LELEKEDAIQSWRELLGPTDSRKAKEENPQRYTKALNSNHFIVTVSSIRALFGTDNQQNAAHGSDSPVSAIKEVSYIFSADIKEWKSESTTLALIKPDVSWNATAVSRIQDLIQQHGLAIAREKQVWLNLEQAATFYKEHEGKAFFPDLLSFMTSAPIMAFELHGNEATSSWRSLIGPTNSAIAKVEKPES